MLKARNKGLFMRRICDVVPTQTTASVAGGCIVREIKPSFMTGKEPPSQNYDLQHSASRGELDRQVRTKILQNREGSYEAFEEFNVESQINS